MSKNIFGFNWLAACVAAVVSESKKAVSATAAAVVGVGLLCSPIESAQAQSVPSILSAEINGCFDDDPTSYELGWEFSSLSVWSDGVFIRRYIPNSCLYEGDYVYLKFSRAVWSSSLNRFVPSPSEWVELWIWMGNDDSEPSAYVYDSDGSFYYVDLYVDGYGPWPTW